MMSEQTPDRRDSDDARPDAGPPTDAVTDEVKESSADTGAGRPAGTGSETTDAGDGPVPEPGPDESTAQVEAGGAEEQAVEGDAS